MSGEKLRKVFFNEPGFDMTEGYRILMGGGPEIEDVQIQTGAEGKEVHNEVVEGFIKRLLTLMRRDRISDSEHECKFLCVAFDEVAPSLAHSPFRPECSPQRIV